MHIRELMILSDLSPRKREEITRHAIQEGFRKLAPADQKEIQSAVESVKIMCVDNGVGDAAALELLAKVGMLLSSQG